MVAGWSVESAPAGGGWTCPGTGAALAASLPGCSPGSTCPPQGCTWSRKECGRGDAEAEVGLDCWQMEGRTQVGPGRPGVLAWQGHTLRRPAGRRWVGEGGTRCYHLEHSSTSGARYQRVATYSVRAWPSGPSGRSLRERARPKSQSFTKQVASRRTLDGWGQERQTREKAKGRAHTGAGGPCECSVGADLLVSMNDTA
jgi:hypothetical protein